MNQILLFALREALGEKWFVGYCTGDAFTEALRILEKWEKEYSDVYARFCEYLTEHQTDVQDLKKNLKRKHKQSLELFKELYPMLTAGSTFMPLMQSETYGHISRL